MHLSCVPSHSFQVKNPMFILSPSLLKFTAAALFAPVWSASAVLAQGATAPIKLAMIKAEAARRVTPVRRSTATWRGPWSVSMRVVVSNSLQVPLAPLWCWCALTAKNRVMRLYLRCVLLSAVAYALSLRAIRRPMPQF